MQATTTITQQQLQKDIAQLEELNLQYLANDQASDVQAYDKILHPRFTASLADLEIYSREDFLAMIAKPRPFTDLTHHDPQLDLHGDFALFHAMVSFRTLDGVPGKARYTDEWIRHGDSWLCIGANVIGETPKASV